MKKKLVNLLTALVLTFCGSLQGYAQREQILLDEDWLFAFGNAASPEKDFGCGTEYFNYLTKAASVHNEGPYSLKFDEKKWGKEWKHVDLPHDWAVDLPFSSEASHSHGYKTIGHKYPETSVGWYRKFITIPASDKGRHLYRGKSDYRPCRRDIRRRLVLRRSRHLPPRMANEDRSCACRPVRHVCS